MTWNKNVIKSSCSRNINKRRWMSYVPLPLYPVCLQKTSYNYRFPEGGLNDGQRILISGVVQDKASRWIRFYLSWSLSFLLHLFSRPNHPFSFLLSFPYFLSIWIPSFFPVSHSFDSISSLQNLWRRNKTNFVRHQQIWRVDKSMGVTISFVLQRYWSDLTKSIFGGEIKAVWCALLANHFLALTFWFRK